VTKKRRHRRSVPRPLYEHVGPYRLCYALGAGGMGAVYLARDDRRAGAGRLVALKRLLREHLSSADLTRMFADEARIASRIRHPNVCSVLDHDAGGAEPYIVMEALAGQSLKNVCHAMERLGEGLPTHRRTALVARVIADACEGLHASHELRDDDGRALSVVHRDVSLDNLFLTYDGVTKLIDFGVVRAERREHCTKTGILKGKFAYIAPELLHGAPPDRRADIWSIGVVLWELLCLRRLFRRDQEVDTLQAVGKLRIPPPSELSPGIPPELDQIVLRALSRDPSERYTTARELSHALTRFIALQGEPTGLADLSEWMRDLFPGGHARHERLRRAAARLPETAPSMGMTPTRSSLRPEFSVCSAPTVARAAPGRARQWASRRARMLVGVAALAAAVAGVAALSHASAAKPTAPQAAPAVRVPAGPYVVEIVPQAGEAPPRVVRVQQTTGD
jgi:eukaryotic-like serine/threonine-protein kinase